MIEQLTKKIKESKLQFDGIYGVPRGGLPLAVAISHRLELPILTYPTPKSLVVDDISDTGKTLANMGNKKIACLFTTDWTEAKPDWFIKKKERQTQWLVFPWEDQTREGDK